VRERTTKLNLIAALVASAVFLWAAGAWAQNQSDRTVRGDSVQQKGQERASVVSEKLPDVDRLSRRGVFFTDWYSRQSCTSGRAAFETGRYPVRAGLTKVGPPGTE
jgi:arylsulfatase A-like enzyme